HPRRASPLALTLPSRFPIIPVCLSPEDLFPLGGRLAFFCVIRTDAREPGAEGISEQRAALRPQIPMKTYSVKAGEIERKWYVVDARGKVLGRLASEVARILRGKHKPIYSPHLDTGDFVVVINAEAIEVTGRKADQKT